MILNRSKQVLFSTLLCISGITALARVDHWSQKRPNNTVVQNQWSGQSGYRPAAGYQPPQPQAHNNNHQQPTYGQNSYNQSRPGWGAQNQHHNNRTQYNYPPVGPQTNQNPWIRNNQTQYQPQQPSYAQRSYNQSRPASGPQQPNYNQGSYNQSHSGWGPQQPSYNQGSYNQSRPGWGPQQPNYNQGSYNQSRPSWGYQPTNSSYRPAQTPVGPPANSHVYPALPNNQPRPANSWSPPANQTLIYPPLPNKPVPVPVQANVGSNGIPLAPLQPQPPQGPHNWHSGGQAALSYGPGHYSQPAASPNNSPPVRQGSSNPYANIFN